MAPSLVALESASDDTRKVVEDERMVMRNIKRKACDDPIITY